MFPLLLPVLLLPALLLPALLLPVLLLPALLLPVLLLPVLLLLFIAVALSTKERLLQHPCSCRIPSVRAAPRHLESKPSLPMEQLEGQLQHVLWHPPGSVPEDQVFHISGRCCSCLEQRAAPHHLLLRQQQQEEQQQPP